MTPCELNNCIKKTVSYAAVRSKAMVLLLLILVAPIVCVGSVFVPCFVMQYSVTLFRFVVILVGKRELSVTGIL